MTRFDFLVVLLIGFLFVAPLANADDGGCRANCGDVYNTNVFKSTDNHSLEAAGKAALIMCFVPQGVYNYVWPIIKWPFTGFGYPKWGHWKGVCWPEDKPAPLLPIPKEDKPTGFIIERQS